MEAIRAFVFLLLAVTFIDAGYIENPAMPVKNPNSSGRRFIHVPHEWINVSMRSEPIVTASLGESLELECEGVGSPPPTLKWHHGPNIVTEAGLVEQNEIVFTTIGKVVSRLVINCVMPHHAGIYSCSGVASVKTKASAPITVIIDETRPATTVACPVDPPAPARIVVHGQTLLENIDKDATLPCAVVGNPRPQVYWLTPRNDVIDTTVVSPHYKMLSNGDLIISHLTWDDMGTYMCVAQNSVGEDKTETFLYPVKKEESE